MKKNIWKAFILAMLLLFLLCGCVKGSYVTRNSVQKNTRTEMSMRYEYFDGYKYKTIEVEEGETKTVSINIVTNGGKLIVYVAKDNDINHAQFYRPDIATGEYSVTLREAGKYTVKVIAITHRGSYKITW